MEIKEIVKLTQSKLYKNLMARFGSIKNRNIWYFDKNFLLIQGSSPVLLVSHLDTVHKEPVKDICMSEDGNIVMSPQGIGGDDRCGVMALCNTFDSVSEKEKPWLLFTCDEEIGCIGARKFASLYTKKNRSKLPDLSPIKLIIEVDRKGSNDAVFYGCDNEDFEKYIVSKGFKTEYGSYSDICDIAPAIGCAAVNLSSGYYNAHTQHEYINLKELKWTTDKIIEIVKESPALPKYEWIEVEYIPTTPYNTYGAYGSYDSYDYQDYYDYYSSKIQKKVSKDNLDIYCDAVDILGQKEVDNFIQKGLDKGDNIDYLVMEVYNKAIHFSNEGDEEEWK